MIIVNDLKFPLWDDPELMSDIWAVLHPLIPLDLNGLLDEYKGWTGKYEDFPFREGAEYFLHALHNDGYNLGVVTAQPDYRIEHLWKYLRQQPGGHLIQVVSNVKIPGIAYPDDRAVYFTGEYGLLFRDILDLRAWWEPEEGPQEPPTAEQRERLGLK